MWLQDSPDTWHHSLPEQANAVNGKKGDNVDIT
jgi:hypothetical protein